MSSQRRTFSASFKAKVVLQLLRGDKTAMKLCWTYKLHPSLLNRWHQEFLDETRCLCEAPVADERVQKILQALPSQAFSPSQGSQHRFLSDVTTRRAFLALLGFAGVGAMGMLTSCESNEIVTVDAKGRTVNRRRLPQLQTFTENLDNNTLLEMVLIPGGTFTMGSPSSESERNQDEGPQHEVSLPDFSLGKYPVTQAQWQAVMGSNASHFKGANRPVEQVTWYKAFEFCQKLSQKSGQIYHLPSEAEWEYACRAGTTTPFYTGEIITPTLANYDGTFTYNAGPKGQYREQTTNVGSFPPNAFGLYDMHGNVWEWCHDTPHKTYTGAPTDGSAWIDENDTDDRIIRGGSWLNPPGNCRCAERFRFTAGFRNYNLGFRVAWVGSSTLP